MAADLTAARFGGEPNRSCRTFLAPSHAEIGATRALRKAAKIIDLTLIAHVVAGDPKADQLGVDHYSFRQAGLL